MDEKLRIIKIIHVALCAGMVMVYVFMGDLFSGNKLTFPYLHSSSVIYIAIPLLAVFLSDFAYKTVVKNTDKSLSPQQKIARYQIATIIRLALIEAGVFLILFIKPDFIIFGLLLICYAIFLRPTQRQFLTDFGDKRI